jgi:hypothetical protein
LVLQLILMVFHMALCVSKRVLVECDAGFPMPSPLSLNSLRLWRRRRKRHFFATC